MKHGRRHVHHLFLGAGVVQIVAVETQDGLVVWSNGDVVTVETEPVQQVLVGVKVLLNEMRH